MGNPEGRRAARNPPRARKEHGTAACFSVCARRLCARRSDVITLGGQRPTRCVMQRRRARARSATAWWLSVCRLHVQPGVVARGRACSRSEHIQPYRARRRGGSERGGRLRDTYVNLTFSVQRPSSFVRIWLSTGVALHCVRGGTLRNRPSQAFASSSMSSAHAPTLLLPTAHQTAPRSTTQKPRAVHHSATHPH